MNESVFILAQVHSQISLKTYFVFIHKTQEQSNSGGNKSFVSALIMLNM